MNNTTPKRVINVRPADKDGKRFYCTILTVEGFGLPCTAFVNDDGSVGLRPQQRKGKDDKYYNVYTSFTKSMLHNDEGNEVIASVNLLDAYADSARQAIVALGK